MPASFESQAKPDYLQVVSQPPGIVSFNVQSEVAAITDGNINHTASYIGELIKSSGTEEEIGELKKDEMEENQKIDAMKVVGNAEEQEYNEGTEGKDYNYLVDI
jgi:hypothetical protein